MAVSPSFPSCSLACLPVWTILSEPSVVNVTHTVAQMLELVDDTLGIWPVFSVVSLTMLSIPRFDCSCFNVCRCHSRIRGPDFLPFSLDSALYLWTMVGLLASPLPSNRGLACPGFVGAHANPGQRQIKLKVRRPPRRSLPSVATCSTASLYIPSDSSRKCCSGCGPKLRAFPPPPVQLSQPSPFTKGSVCQNAQRRTSQSCPASFPHFS